MQASIEQIDKITDSLMRACSDTNIMMRDAINAILQSSTILTKGCEEMCDSMSTLMQKSLENGALASRAIIKAKSVNDVMDVQSGLMKSGFDSIMAETNRITQLSSRIAQEAAEPVAQHMNAAITKLSLVKAA
jgi:phasin family protein